MEKYQTMINLKTIILTSLFLFFHNSAYAGFGPKTHSYKEISPLFGTWGGQLFGKNFEFAVWPNQAFNHVSGVMIWGSCKAEIKVSYKPPEVLSRHGISKENPELGLNQYLFSLSSYLGYFKFKNSRCPKRDRPGYSSLYLSSDKRYSKLVAYTKGQNKWPKLKKHTGSIIRKKPSNQLVEAINKMGRKNGYELNKVSKIVIYDPTKNYLTLAEKHKPGLLRAQDFPNQPEKVETKASGYWQKYHYPAYMKRQGKKVRGLHNFDEFPYLLHSVFLGNTPKDIYDIKKEMKRMDFNEYYVILISSYEDACREQLKKGSVDFRKRITKTKTNRYGSTISESTSYTPTIRIKKIWVKSYEKASNYLWPKTERKIIYSRFHELLKMEGCSSPTVEQLIENFHRLVLRKYSIQGIAKKIEESRKLYQ